MSEYTRKPRSSRHNKKHMPRILLVLCLMLVVMVGSIAGTVAWLTDKTDEVKNTFTVGDINITLTETWNTDTDGDNVNDAWKGKVVPGVNLSKDPEVTVKANSEPCWVFVKVTESNWPDIKDTSGNRKINYAIATGWTALDNVSGVYYRTVDSIPTTDTEFHVLADNHVTVSSSLTKTEVNTLSNKDFTLTFKAYAIQKSGFDNATAAWNEVSKETN